MKLEIISIVIPVYKVDQYLEQCILSVLNQTYKNLEILLIDDGSPDQSGTICDEWAKKDSRIKVIHKENGGLSDARNTGLNICNGEFIAFVDSDDFIAPTMMEELIAVLKKEGADIAECNYLCFSDRQELFKKKAKSIRKVTGYSAEEALDLLLDETEFKYVVWNKLYRKNILDSLRFEVGKLHEDVFFTYQVFGICKKIIKYEVPLYYYRQRNESIMGNMFSIHNLDTLDARKEQYLYMKEKFPQLSGKAQSQLLENCLYLGQKALREADNLVSREALKRIKVIFNKTYDDQTIRESKKQRIWYRIARCDLHKCCVLRNSLKVGF